MLEPKILKGTRDHGPMAMAKRDLVMAKIRQVFQSFGYDTIETPVIEYAEMILGKYGDEGDKLTYHFQDNGDRHIALRYDQTVPFARYFAMNHQELSLPFKRYQISRVWRADKPQRGRLREFYQCDIDIIGTDSVNAELECVLVIDQVLTTLGFADFEIQINDRRLLTAVLASIGVDGDEFTAVVRILDKLDKVGEAVVVEELEKLGLTASQIQQIQTLLLQKASNDNLLEALATFDLADLRVLLASSEKIVFNPALARGLDYYTGIIFEVILRNDRSLGTICAGGRYANLCSMFSKQQFSGVGVAFGFERLVEALEARGQLAEARLATQVLVVNFGGELAGSALSIAQKLRQAGVSTEFYFDEAKLPKQFKHADKKGIPWVVICGEDEVKKGTVVLKDMRTGEQEELKQEQLVERMQ